MSKRKGEAPAPLDWFSSYPPEHRDQAERYFRLCMDNWFNQAFADMGFATDPQGHNVIPLEKHRKAPRNK